MPTRPVKSTSVVDRMRGTFSSILCGSGYCTLSNINFLKKLFKAPSPAEREKTTTSGKELFVSKLHGKPLPSETGFVFL